MRNQSALLHENKMKTNLHQEQIDGSTNNVLNKQIIPPFHYINFGCIWIDLLRPANIQTPFLVVTF